MSDNKKVIVALDYTNLNDALLCVKTLNPDECRVKVGKELFTYCGPVVVEQLQSLGFEVFLDLKFHDIPHTVAKAVAAAASLGVWMVNVHASGGEVMMREAKKALEAFESPPLLTAVTVLTSMGEEDYIAAGFSGSLQERVAYLAQKTQDCGLNGVVCSAKETASLRQQCGADFLLVTPGIRPTGSALGDQKRVVTPIEAIKGGSDYLVIGRPITKSDNPLGVLRNINKDIAYIGA